ncbi:MAG TPA: hypothetical protein ENK34_01900 [Rhodobacteraceae bacterium]|nr:hypothetical protein [Paracoccaceae bacterium]
MLEPLLATTLAMPPTTNKFLCINKWLRIMPHIILALRIYRKEGNGNIHIIVMKRKVGRGHGGFAAAGSWKKPVARISLRFT